MRAGGVLGVAFALVISGCLSSGSGEAPSVPEAEWLAGAVWNTTGNYSRVLAPGLLEVLPGERNLLPMADGVVLDSVVWRPKVAPGVQVPVILDVGPYYGSSIGLLSPNGRENVFFIENFVKNGYAYGRVAIRGTSTSGGCMEFFGPNEQRDVDEAVTFYGTQDWSNGNVALYGASYDGTTPWIAASFGNPHLKTIVPVSGLSDVGHLMFRNGTAEGRGVFMHSYVYWYNFGLAPTSTRPNEAKLASFCDEVAEGAATGPWSTVTGERTDLPGPMSDYWEVRDWTGRVKENYEGSVLLVHGLQDWNVENTMAFPFVNELIAGGTEVKMMLGQWGHAYPDAAQREDHVRWDWGEVLLGWFDKYLMGNATRDTGPAVDVEDNHDKWRTEEAWPPADANWTVFHLGDGVLAREPTASGESVAVQPHRLQFSQCIAVACVPPNPTPPLEEEGFAWRFDLPPLEEDLRVAGLPRLHVTVEPTSPRGGNLYAMLRDVAPNGTFERVAHGVMNLRYHHGGTEAHDIVPGESVVAMMELFGADALVEKGHALQLVVWPDTGGEPRGSATPTPITLLWGDGASVLKLPVVERDVGEGKYPGDPGKIVKD